MSPSSTEEANSKMEQSHSLILNEEAFRQCPDPLKNVFIYEWLGFLDRILPHVKKTDLKDCQQKLLEQLTARIVAGCSQPSRILLGRCIARIFKISDASLLFQTINVCNDALKDPSVQGIAKMTALNILGEMYENLGRMVGRTYEETFQALTKWMKHAESGARLEIFNTLSKMIEGLGSGIFPIYKDLYKIIAKTLSSDRVLHVRVAAAKCFACLVIQSDSPLFVQHDLDSICTHCFKALNPSNIELRQEISSVFGNLALNVNTSNHKQKEGNSTQKQLQTPSNSKSISIDELL